MHDQTLTAVIGCYDDAPAETNMVSQYRNLLHHYTHRHSCTDVSHFWSGIGAIRRSVFDRIGGFDAVGYRHALEDVELGYRLRAAGEKIYLDMGIQGKHLKRYSIRSMLATDLFHRAIPWTQLLLARGGIPDDLSLGTAQRLSVITAWLIPMALAVSLFVPALWPLPLLGLALFVFLNRDFLRFIHRTRGLKTSIASLGLHWLYHFNSGLGFLYGLLRQAMPFAIAPRARRMEEPAE